jgi:hypothetical protein
MDKNRNRSRKVFCGGSCAGDATYTVRTGNTDRKGGSKDPPTPDIREQGIEGGDRMAGAWNMIIDLSKARIFIRPGYTDLRKTVNGLSVMIEQQMGREPFSGNVYLFCNRERKLLKAVYWDKTGFWLSQKRLEKDRYPWPQDEGEARELKVEQLQMLLAGIDFFNAHKELWYTKVA